MIANEGLDGGRSLSLRRECIVKSSVGLSEARPKMAP